MKKDILYSVFQFLLLGSYFVLSFLDFSLFDFSYKPSNWLSLLLGVIFLIGISIIFLGIVNMGFSSSKSNINLSENNIRYKGIYNFIRHPIYLGIFICLFTYAIYTFCIINIFLSLLIWGFYYFKSKYEDKQLEAQFLFYRDYNKRTGRFFPKKNKK